MKYLESNPGIGNGALVIKGTRIKLASILAMLAAGMSLKYIANRYPWLELSKIQGALKEASEHFQSQPVHV